MVAPIRAGFVGFASGWMRLRGTRRRRAVDRGFVLSDHVDWPGLLAAIDARRGDCLADPRLHSVVAAGS